MSATVEHPRADLRKALVAAIGDEQRVSAGPSVLDQHGADLTLHAPHRPDVVVFARSVEEVSAVLALANERRTPVTPFGLGTSLEGHVIPTAGGISLDLSRMTKVLAVRPRDLSITVQPGVTRSAVNAAAGEHGLCFPVDPGADATVGGMAATNASGTTTVRYGSMRRQVLGLQAVLADGRVVRAGGRSLKTSAGYDITDLLVGSEGTLGVITELTIRLHGIPEHTLAARAVFADVDAACRTATALIAWGVPVVRLELLDAHTVAAVNAFKGSDFVEAPSLFIELAGSRASVEADVQVARELADEHGGASFQFDSDNTARARLWEARHDAAFAVMALAPGRKPKSTDVCVPLSELPDAIAFARAQLEAHGIEAGVAGHIGDGNYHVAMMVDPADLEEIARVSAFERAIVDDALVRGGTCSGEHGIGLGKIGHLQREHGDLVPVMQAIKASLDPNWILNPGKVIPAL
ncbi:MAG: FAD-binding oxidoreductase [Solirubrobacteraceae bacterium]